MAGKYQMDQAETRLLFCVRYLGFSNYMALFTEVSADLSFDPVAPETMQVRAKSLETHYPDPAVDFNAQITAPELQKGGSTIPRHCARYEQGARDREITRTA